MSSAGAWFIIMNSINSINRFFTKPKSRLEKYIARREEKAKIDWEEGHQPISLIQSNDPDDLFVEVLGAGKMKISKSINHYCGGTFGFSIEPSWTAYGYSGGVMSHEDARKMATMILDVLDRDFVEQKKRHDIYINKYRTE